MIFSAKVFLILILGNVLIQSSSWSQSATQDSLRISEHPIYDTFLPGDIVKIGIQSGFIFTGKLDTGMDCGVRATQRFFHPFLRLTTQAHFWAASKKDFDIGAAGLEESITYQIPVMEKLMWYGGFAIGYLSIRREHTTVIDGEHVEVSTRDNYFEPFITMGAEYLLDNNRSVFIEWKIGSTTLREEVHLILGLNFFRHHKAK